MNKKVMLVLWIFIVVLAVACAYIFFNHIFSETCGALMFSKNSTGQCIIGVGCIPEGFVQDEQCRIEITNQINSYSNNSDK